MNDADDAAVKKKEWKPPTLESLEIKDTAYWEYQWDIETGWWKEVWIS
ncbi:hypothetical protein ACFOLF_25555 [Paenibacillus sepulcri]|uniref:Uncharacterized protein n=1 Tax=Paenibacillus sepulcri TaxID=359917 RepID=A0ABS7C3T2_9BACL|nr:hypothetical protein [Paenibacillus sepulcri]